MTGGLLRMQRRRRTSPRGAHRRALFLCAGMDNIAQSCYCERMKEREILKRDGFPGERMIVLPTETFSAFAQHPIIRRLYVTDVGYFPKAKHHYRKRVDGADEHIFLYCADGEGTVKVAGQTYALGPRQALCIPRLVAHEYFASPQNPWSLFWVHFKGSDSRQYPIFLMRLVSFQTEASAQRMLFLFELLLRVLDANYTEGNFIYISHVLQLILSETYYREKLDSASDQNRLATRMIRYMYDNLTANMTLDELTEYFRLSKSYLNSLFLKFTNRTPIDFFINLKMRHACERLRSTADPVYEIAKQLGYDDPYYFSRLFKKHIGVAPKHYRQNDLLRGGFLPWEDELLD